MESETEPHELSAKFVCSLSRIPARWASCHFYCTGSSSLSASTAGAFAELGFWCVWPLPCSGHAEVVSASLNWSHGTIDVVGVLSPRFCLITTKI